MSAHLSRLLTAWQLIPDGEPIITHTSELFPVTLHRTGEPAMLKITADAHEQTGKALMAAWDGRGAARVIAQDAGAVLLERTTGGRFLTAMSATGEDDRACEILCRTVNTCMQLRCRSFLNSFRWMNGSVN